MKGIGEKVVLRSNFLAIEIFGFPDVFVRRRVPLFECVKNIRPTVSPTGSSNFPEILSRHGFECGARLPMFWTVKYRLPFDKLLLNAEQAIGGLTFRFHGAPRCKLQRPNEIELTGGPLPGAQRPHTGRPC